MRRLAGIALLMISATASPRLPGDVESMNKFAALYNRYVEGLQSGLVDVKGWARVESAWKALK